MNRSTQSQVSKVDGFFSNKITMNRTLFASVKTSLQYILLNYQLFDINVKINMDDMVCI